MSKRRRQFGSIRKLPSGKWQVRYPNGTGRVVTAPDTFPTRGDAARFLSVVEADMTRGQYLDPRAGRMSFSQWSTQWLARPGKRANSVARDRQALGLFEGSLGPVPMAAVTPMQVQAVVDARAKVAAPSTVARDFSTLRAVLNAAVDADVIGRSPARKVKLPKVTPPERSGLSPAELVRLAEAVPGRYRALILTAGVLGLRWGEVVALRVRDVDFLRRTVNVAQTVEEVAGHLRVLNEAKSRGSLRTMTAPGFLVDELARHLAAHRSGADPDDLVFVGPRGGILRRNFGTRILRPALACARLDTARSFHWLRHDALTALVDANVHPRVMQGRAGHATSKLTMELYAHVTDASDRAAADALETRFRPALAGDSGTGMARTVREPRHRA